MPRVNYYSLVLDLVDLGEIGRITIAGQDCVYREFVHKDVIVVRQAL